MTEATTIKTLALNWLDYNLHQLKNDEAQSNLVWFVETLEDHLHDAEIDERYEDCAIYRDLIKRFNPFIEWENVCELEEE